MHKNEDSFFFFLFVWLDKIKKTRFPMMKMYNFRSYVLYQVRKRCKIRKTMLRLENEDSVDMRLKHSSYEITIGHSMHVHSISSKAFRKLFA